MESNHPLKGIKWIFRYWKKKKKKQAGDMQMGEAIWGNSNRFLIIIDAGLRAFFSPSLLHAATLETPKMELISHWKKKN